MAITGISVGLGLLEALERLAAALIVSPVKWWPDRLATVTESPDAARQPNGKLEIRLSG